MNISLETIGRIYAGARNQANSVIGFAAGIGVISAAQQKGFTDSITEIYNGIAMVVHGATSFYQIGLIVVGPIVGFVLTWYAQRSAKTENKQASIIATAADPSDSGSAVAKAQLVTAAAVVAKDPTIGATTREEAKIAVVNAASSLPEVHKVIAPELSDNPATAPEVVKQ